MSADHAYIDTSVLGAYYCPEPCSAAAEDALRKLTTRAISALSEVEFSSLLAKKRRLRELSGRRAKETLDLFEAHLAAGSYRRLSLTNEHFARARQLLGGTDSPLRTLDALHLAVAAAEDLVLITADRQFAAAVRRHKGSVVLIE